MTDAVAKPRVRDVRQEIPELGLPEYWYPAIEASKVGSRRPTSIRIMDRVLALFRGADGSVAAVSDICPHRGAKITQGQCHFRGTITCPYHAWTFDERGECVAVLSEGPESVIPGREDARIRVFPTRTIHGMVFVWMGDGPPAPIEEDVPEEFFEPGFSIRYTTVDWNVNWRLSVENILDSHAIYVHRNSIEFYLLSREALLGLANLGPRRPKPDVINNRAIDWGMPNIAAPGKRDGPPRAKPYRRSYPGLGGQKWPKYGARLIWHNLVSLVIGKVPPPLLKTREWTGAFHLPGYARFDFGSYVYTRATVPIDPHTSRIIYFFATKANSWRGRGKNALWFTLWKNWSMHYNFSGQDQLPIESQTYTSPEHMSPTDIFPISIRRLILTHARGLPVTPTWSQEALEELQRDRVPYR